MKSIKIPRFLHEFFGEETTLNNLIAIFSFSLFMTFLTYLFGEDELLALNLYQRVLLIVFMFDIYGGVIANFMKPTKDYYAKHKTLKKLFVILHPHALLIAWLSGIELTYGIYLYSFLVAANVIVCLMKKRHIQELVAILLTLVSVILIFISFQDVPTYIDIMYFALVIKLIYAFSVDQIAVKSL